MAGLGDMLGCARLSGEFRVYVFALQSGYGEERVAQCGVCGKVFSGRSRKHNLKQHILTHTGERPHSCPHCPYRSSHRPTLRRHVFTVHARLADLPATAVPPFPSATFSHTR
uniref:C2H2-type domain-containing protein n=1 Tax=Scylla olivacea TaxID=85551 RepID=A0A0P4VTP5_SCYOL